MPAESTSPPRPSPGVNGLPRLFRVFQQAPQIRTLELPLIEQRLTPIEVSAQKQLDPYSLATTEYPGVYWYRDQSGATGWLRTENFYGFEVGALQQLIVVEELGEAVGIAEPWMQDKPVVSAGQPRAGNPYVLITSAVAVFGIAVFGLVTTIGRGLQYGGFPGWGSLIAILVLGLLMPLSVGLGVRGVVRLRWWRAARAEAKRRGIDVPDKLTGLGI